MISFRVGKSLVKNGTLHDENIPNICQIKYSKLSVYFRLQGLTNYFDKPLKNSKIQSLNNTLSISYSPRPLATGPMQNSEIMESFQYIGYLMFNIKAPCTSMSKQ